jgi:SPP1 family predicted phage head-tail adaptor
MIGKMRHRITLQKEVRVADGGGGFTITWTNVATDPSIWASIVPVSTAENLRSMQLQVSITHRITIRYRSDITGALRVLYGGRVFNVRGIKVIEERDRWIELSCEEGVAI